jgi:hypothetical protein
MQIAYLLAGSNPKACERPKARKCWMCAFMNKI